MSKTALFRGLTEENVKKMIDCMHVKTEKFNPGETIMSYNRNIEIVGVLEEGEAALVSFDESGNRMMLDLYDKDAVFGESFSVCSGIDAASVVAVKPCTVLFFHYRDLISPCEKNCAFHATFSKNLISLLTKRLRSQAAHIESLSKRTIRGKLLAFFEMRVKETDSLIFTLPFSLSTLADFLSVDRSAMQRELKKLREEGRLFSKGRKIEILKRF